MVVGDRASRRLGRRGSTAPIEVCCVCGATYEIAAELLHSAVCSGCGRPLREVGEVTGISDDSDAQFFAELNDDYVEIPGSIDVPDATSVGTELSKVPADHFLSIRKGSGGALSADNRTSREQQRDRLFAEELRALFQDLSPGDTLKLTVDETGRGRSAARLLVALHQVAASFGFEVEAHESQVSDG